MSIVTGFILSFSVKLVTYIAYLIIITKFANVFVALNHTICSLHQRLRTSSQSTIEDTKQII